LVGVTATSHQTDLTVGGSKDTSLKESSDGYNSSRIQFKYPR